MVIFVPEGCTHDQTRRGEYYDQTYDYLRSLGIPELHAQQSHAPDALPHAGDAPGESGTM
jgi:hypothetical protein